jgi:hypothetical protein
VLWEASDRVCGKRLKALLPILLPALERYGHLKLEEHLRAKILSMSGGDDRPLAADAKEYDAREEGPAGRAGAAPAHQDAHLCRLE